MRNLVSVIFTSGLFLFSYSAFSQSPAGRNFQGGGMPMDAKVTGVVVDGTTSQPVQYAVVAIHRNKDSSLVSGISTDQNGNFSVEGLSYGRFYAEITFVGYKKQVVGNIVLNPSQKIVNLGNVKISPLTTNIQAVVVTGDKPPIQYGIDKKVVDVTQNTAAAGGTLVDALQNIPSIQTDVEGNVTLRGSSNFTVLIDGRPSPISGSEALQQIPASAVQSVEIITNPSAKYEAEGGAGIVNVIMKKRNVSGMNGIFNVTAGTRDKYSGNLNLNYMVNKFNFSLGADFTDMKYRVSNFTNNVDTLDKDPFRKDSIRNELINGAGSFRRQGLGLRAGIDYTIDDKNSLSLSGSVGNRNFTRAFNSTYNDQYFFPNVPVNNVFYINDNSGKFHRSFYNLNLDYLLKLNNNGHQLSASAYFSQGPEDNISTLLQDTTGSNWKVDTTMRSWKNRIDQRVEQNTNETELRTKADYSLPIGEKGKLEAGYQGRYDVNRGDYHVYALDAPGDPEDFSKRDSITFKDQIQAGYITFSNSMVLFDYQLGMRAEYENRTFDQIIQGKKYYLDRLDFFPSIHVSRELPWDLQIQASYTRRIDRPRDWNLNPVTVYVDPQTVRRGNADLKPQFTNSYELNLQKKLTDISFISAEGFYREGQNLIQQRTTFDPVSAIRVLSFENIDHDRSIGAEFMLNLALAKWFNFNSSWSVFNYHLYGTLFPSVANTTNTWNLRVNPSIRFNWGTSIQMNYTYNAPTITAQGTRSGFYSSSVGIKQDLFKRKASLTFQMQNPFGRTRLVNTINSTSTYSYNWFQRESQVFLLTFSYKINNYKTQQNKRNQEDMNNNNQDQDMNGM